MHAVQLTGNPATMGHVLQWESNYGKSQYGITTAISTASFGKGLDSLSAL